MPEKEHLEWNDSTLAIEEIIRIINREKQRKDNLEIKSFINFKSSYNSYNYFNFSYRFYSIDFVS